MFATLLGGLPQPPLDDAGGGSGAGSRLEREVEAAVRAQEAAGLEPVTDGRRSDQANPVVARWRLAAGLTDRSVKQALPGPWATLRAVGVTAAERRRRGVAVVAALRDDVEALAAAGCPLVEIEEWAAGRIGDDTDERALFRDLHARLLDGLEGVHLSLSLTGPAADAAGLETILAAPYASFAFDLIAGPDNWRLAVNVPGDRGVVVGVLSDRTRGPESKETMLWAARYAAASNGRGMVRVGLGSAGGYGRLAWDEAVRRMGRLGEAARLAAQPPGPDVDRQLDPRSISARTAALGHDAPRPRPARRAGPRGGPGGEPS